MVRLARILLILLPIAEIAVLIAVADWIGIGQTLLALLGAAIAGIVVIRVLGAASLAELRRALERREPPAGALLRGACVLVAGVLLILPGFISDALAVLLLIPPLRTAALGMLWRAGGRMKGPVNGPVNGPAGGQASGRPTAGRPGGTGSEPVIIEGEYHEMRTEHADPRIDDQSAADKPHPKPGPDA